MSREEKDFLESPLFENVSAKIGYCGLWCGSCAVGNGTIRDLAGKLERLTKGYGIREWGPDEIDYKRFHKDLRLIHGLPSCAGCSEEGGNPACKIRACAIGKGLEECVDCDEVNDCPNRKALTSMRSGAKRVGMVVKKERGSRAEFIKEWKT